MSKRALTLAFDALFALAPAPARAEPQEPDLSGVPPRQIAATTRVRVSSRIPRRRTRARGPTSPASCR